MPVSSEVLNISSLPQQILQQVRIVKGKKGKRQSSSPGPGEAGVPGLLPHLRISKCAGRVADHCWNPSLLSKVVNSLLSLLPGVP